MDIEIEHGKTMGSALPPGAGQQAAGSFLDRIRARMAGTVTIPAGVDLTEPTDPEWARVYDDDHEYPLHL